MSCQLGGNEAFATLSDSEQLYIGTYYITLICFCFQRLLIKLHNLSLFILAHSGLICEEICTGL